jgi:hypothetical protein
MIVTNIIGGLGNQMFQYAAGLALSAETGAPLAIATDMFENYALHHGFELERVFGVQVPRADALVLRDLVGWRASPQIRRALARVAALDPVCGRHFLPERPETTAERFFSASADTYLHGYWQSERFFGRHADRIRAKFSFAELPDAENADLLTQIAARRSASVHVRRGDYLTSKNAAIYNQCSPSYFVSSMDLLQDRVGPLKFYVFSDDPPWAEEFFNGKGYDCRIVAHNKGAASFNDMRLMSACDHHVIANSSFSWWGAWLNPKANKVVIAPREWMAGTSSSSVVPADWLQR